MKKTFITVALACALLGSTSLTSCIGSFQLTNKVMSWNKQVGNKFVNELVFFAFWVLPVYEVTSIADLLVLNSIEFWSGNNPLSASTKVVDTDHGRYMIACDGKGYTVTNELTGEETRFNFTESTQTWSVVVNGKDVPMMTFLDDTHVKMIAPAGEYRVVELSKQGVLAYQDMVAPDYYAAR